MNRISEAEFAAICEGINADRDKIFKHNPTGTPDETLLWMLMSVLISYLSIEEMETPGFNGMPDAQTYRNAVSLILGNRRIGDFESEPIIEKMLTE